MDRKEFLKQSIVGFSILGVTPALALNRTTTFQEEPEPINKKTVKEFVVAGHRDLGKLEEMLNEKPNLLYAKYDWGNGDFEEAIEGAGHLGNKEIARYLIEKGARVNLFVMTMLGQIALVKPILETYPSLIHALGPHGFTLLHHAKAGDAKEMVDYLESKGLTKTHVSIK